jgi:hypothetical protein
MSIKYGELTIDHKETTLFNNLSMWFGYEQRATKLSKLIFLFDDGEIYEANDNSKDFQFNFVNSYITKMPLYFENKDKTTFFYKNAIIKENNLHLNFTSLFSLYEKFNLTKYISSSYNCIFFSYTSELDQEVLGILRIKSSDTMPRFQFAYDSNHFTKEEVIYIINYIFTQINE